MTLNGNNGTGTGGPQITVSPELGQRITELARVMNVTPDALVEMLIRSGLDQVKEDSGLLEELRGGSDEDGVG